jgi:hypothetical protein
MKNDYREIQIKFEETPLEQEKMGLKCYIALYDIKVQVSLQLMVQLRECPICLQFGRINFQLPSNHFLRLKTSSQNQVSYQTYCSF